MTMDTYEKTGATIYIHRRNGWIIIYDDAGNRMQYLYHTYRYALSDFKEQFGYKYKRGVKIQVV